MSLKEPWCPVVNVSAESNENQMCIVLTLAVCPWESDPTFLGLGCVICKRRKLDSVFFKALSLHSPLGTQTVCSTLLLGILGLLK